jgi:putative ABC transport system ATP-binding protein
MKKDLIKKIALEQDVAVIMVTHDEAMLPLCDRILKIENKKVVSSEVPKKTHIL